MSLAASPRITQQQVFDAALKRTLVTRPRWLAPHHLLKQLRHGSVVRRTGVCVARTTLEACEVSVRRVFEVGYHNPMDTAWSKHAVYLREKARNVLPIDVLENV
jgi:hypothetical protein